jgi:prevent-host-death family protein
MALRITATDAKNKFGDLLELAAWHGRVDIVRHGRVVASVVAPRAIEELEKQSGALAQDFGNWRATHMFPAAAVRNARVLDWGAGFDDDEA